MHAACIWLRFFAKPLLGLWNLEATGSQREHLGVSTRLSWLLVLFNVCKWLLVAVACWLLLVVGSKQLFLGGYMPYANGDLFKSTSSRNTTRKAKSLAEGSPREAARLKRRCRLSDAARGCGDCTNTFMKHRCHHVKPATYATCVQANHGGCFRMNGVTVV